MIGFNKSLLREERGAAIIEMGLLLPVMATVVIGVADVSRAYSQKLILEQAAYRAIEKVQQYQSSESTYSTLQNDAVSAATAAGFTDVTTSNATVDYWLECNGVRQGNGTPGNGYDAVCTSGQTYARWISIDVTHNFMPMFASSKWPGSNSDGSYTLHGRAALRTQ
ncbi:MAG TPA: TadE/TadG family type IV pilus assembly protein [Sphingomicrobium sp.]|jgi:Flp pilus assembly protein TadG|nr:TadE/TadG family type IV pilus assembly protein [Sphingomicrobium sp.]